MTTRKKPRDKQSRQAEQASRNRDVPAAGVPPHLGGPYDEERTAVPLIEETLQVDKGWVEAGAVELRKTVQTRPQTVPIDLAHEELDIQRVTVNRALAYGEETGPKQVGDVLIIPIIEEEMVVTKRQVVREEVRIRKKQVTTRQQVSDTIRSEQLEIKTTDGLQVTEEQP